VANKSDLVIQQGDDFSLVVPIFGDDGFPMILTDNGTSLTNPYTAQAQLRRDNADADPTVDATFSTTVFPIGSRVQLALNSATTTGLVNGPYVWDLQLTAPASMGSTKTTVAYGKVSIRLERTR